VYEITASSKNPTEITAMLINADTAVVDNSVAILEKTDPDCYLIPEKAEPDPQESFPVLDKEDLAAWIIHSAGLMTRMAMTGVDLKTRRIDIAPVESLITDVNKKLAIARKLLSAGDNVSAALELSLVRETMISLSDVCYTFLSDTNIPQGSAPGLASITKALRQGISTMELK